MALYKYIAKAPDGQVLRGDFEVEYREKLMEILHNKGFLVMEIKEVKEKQFTFRLNHKVSNGELSLFCRQFHTMLNASISILECLDVLSQQVNDKKLAKALRDMYESIQKGSTLTKAISEHSKLFPQILIAMVEVGEISGTLSKSLDRMAIYFEKEKKISQKVKSAMAYPMVIGGIAVLVVLFLMIFVIPQFTDMYKSFGQDLPLPTKIIMAISGGNKQVIAVLLGSIIGIIIITKYIKSSDRGKYFINKVYLSMPIIGKYTRRVLAYRFSMTLSELLFSGVPLIKSLEMCGKVLNNQLFHKKIEAVINNVSMGSALAGPFEEMNIFPAMVIKMIKIGEEAGTLDEMMRKVSEYYDDEINVTIDKLVSMVEPVMLLVLALVVGFIVIAMILPIFNSYQFMAA